jgi:RimJ/RimL family protein N-acetyltransferase
MHVGNIKIGKIDSFHMHAEVGIMIGEKGCWGKGYGTEAIGLVLKYAFNELCLNKLTAGMYSENVGAFKSFVNNGFRKVGVFRKHVLFKGRYIDMIAVERSRF